VISNEQTISKLKKYKMDKKEDLVGVFDKMFGEPLKATKERIAKNSVFGNLKTWDILYIIVKTHDDLKQEQFAMQLIQQFDYIFKLEGLPLILTTYEVLSMGADRGII
jgi:phosphatidylinositol 4-kinase B